MKLSITLVEARQILASEPMGTERFALANTIISLHASNEVLMTVAQDDDGIVNALESDLSVWRERGRLLADAVREHRGETWEPSQIEGWQ